MNSWTTDDLNGLAMRWLDGSFSNEKSASVRLRGGRCERLFDSSYPLLLCISLESQAFFRTPSEEH